MPFVVYSVLRLALFAACLGLLWWAGLRSWLVAVVAAFLAWALSYVLLNGPRDAAARQLAERAERRRRAGDRAVLGKRAQEDADLEDAADEAARGLESQPHAEQHAERELEEPGAGEHGDQRAAAGAEQHGDRQHDRGREQHQHDQRPD